MISGSPFVREVAELAVGVYTPEGDNIAQSTGIQVHIRPMGEAIQWMIEHDWEDKVGINDGDLFWFNDSSKSAKSVFTNAVGTALLIDSARIINEL